MRTPVHESEDCATAGAVAALTAQFADFRVEVEKQLGAGQIRLLEEFRKQDEKLDARNVSRQALAAAWAAVAVALLACIATVVLALVVK